MNQMKHQMNQINQIDFEYQQYVHASEEHVRRLEDPFRTRQREHTQWEKMVARAGVTIGTPTTEKLREIHTLIQKDIDKKAEEWSGYYTCRGWFPKYQFADWYDNVVEGRFEMIEDHLKVCKLLEDDGWLLSDQSRRDVLAGFAKLREINAAKLAHK